ncbi:MAG: hypothetical protein IPM88_19290 [Nitrospira sp.]|nr:hypothetical protein [Nitrospira sp.]
MTEISIYETNSGSIEVRLERETVWLSQEQCAIVQERSKTCCIDRQTPRAPPLASQENLGQPGIGVRS